MRVSEVSDSGSAEHQDAEHGCHDGVPRQHGLDGYGEVGMRRHRLSSAQTEVDQKAYLSGLSSLQPAVVDA